MIVTDFLNQYFDSVMDYGFTARIEEEFDEIANGKKVWNKMLNEFYKPFHEDVANTLEKAERVKGERLLGEDPETGKPIVARMGRYGPMIQIGKAEDEEKPRFAKLKATQSIETITLPEAMELFRLPRNLGMFEGQEVTVNIGRFGPYAQHDKKFYSLKKEMDPYTVELDEVAPLIVEKRAAKDERTIKVFEKEKIQILKGPYGPYIKQGLRNYKIPKERIDHAAEITVEEAKAIIEDVKANPPKKKAPPRKKKTE
jgi:DNA topoisomerase-1